MASLVPGLVGVIQLESQAFISAGWPLWGPVRAFRGQQVAGRPRVGWGWVPRSLPAGRRGGRGMKPHQHSGWCRAVKWPVRAAWALGGCLLTPETLFMKGSSPKHCSPGQGTKGSECSFVWRCSPRTHSPFFFLPLSHCWLCLCPHAWGERWMVEMGSGQTVLGEPSVLG